MENKKVVISKEDCNLCKHTLMCIIARMFEVIPTCVGVTFDEGGCPALWEIEETQAPTVEVDHARPTTTTPTL